jgi:hypothetical protein
MLKKNPPNLTLYGLVTLHIMAFKGKHNPFLWPFFFGGWMSIYEQVNTQALHKVQNKRFLAIVDIDLQNQNILCKGKKNSKNRV